MHGNMVQYTLALLKVKHHKLQHGLTEKKIGLYSDTDTIYELTMSVL